MYKKDTFKLRFLIIKGGYYYCLKKAIIDIKR
jgi:hypothetical protein